MTGKKYKVLVIFFVILRYSEAQLTHKYQNDMISIDIQRIKFIKGDINGSHRRDKKTSGKITFCR